MRYLCCFFTILLITIPCSAATKQTALPITTFQNNIPIIIVNIQGHNIPVRFDIGGAVTGINLSTATIKKYKLNLHFSGTRKCHYEGDYSNHICRDAFITPHVRLGAFLLSNIVGTKINKNFTYDGTYRKNHVVNSIGLLVLNKFGLLIDYRHNKIILTKNARPPLDYNIDTWTSVPIDVIKNHGIFSDTLINGSKIRLVWDTGSSCSYLTSTAKINTKREKVPDKNACSRILIKTTKFTIGDKLLPNTIFYIRNVHHKWGGAIGSDFFKKNLVFIDFKHHKLFLKHFIPKTSKTILTCNTRHDFSHIAFNNTNN